MKPHTALILVVSSVALAATADPVKRDFESDAVGAPPAGFEFGSDHERASQISLRRVSVFRAGTSTGRPFLVSVLDAVAVRSVSLNTPT